MGLLDQNNYAGYAQEGQRLAVEPMSFTPMDAARFVAEATPIIGDAMAAKEVYDELQKPDPNYAMVAALGGAALVGLVPGLGDAMAAGIKKGARGLLDTAKRIEVDPSMMGSMGGNLKVRRDIPNEKRGNQVLVRIPVKDVEHGESAMPGGKLTRPSSRKLIKEYSEKDTKIPPIEIMSYEDGLAMIADGSHRFEAAKLRGQDYIEAYVNKDDFLDLPSAEIIQPSPSLPNPRNEAEAMAKKVLEMRASGNARDVTEKMMNAVDDQYMFKNTPLNMSEGARKLRADQLGYNKELFHGGQGGIKAMDADIAGGQDYDTGIWSTTDRYNANRYAGSPTENPTAGRDFSTDAFDLYDDRGAVYPLLGKTDNYAKTNFEGANWGDAPKYARMNFKQDGIPTRKKISDMTQDWASWASSPEAARAARTTDSSGLLIKDVVDIGSQFPHPDHIGLSPEMATTAVTFDPTTLRSKFARFDPEFKHLKNLTAAGLLAPGVLTAMQEYKKQQELERGLLSY